eukprot:TRINITY_DN18329_c0_g1_i1.p1 TRINITY_DN18329_c0_g1~~TRINITY_DN18329_c0_g1_i1.p1  ORF type:complete len:915 (+),score=224.12 TRINITY_DN18329_c0_g1_i1:69-2747(+)
MEVDAVQQRRIMVDDPVNPWQLADQMRLLEQYPHARNAAREWTKADGLETPLTIGQHRALMGQRARHLLKCFADRLWGMDLQYLCPDGKELKALHDKLSAAHRQQRHRHYPEDIDNVPGYGDPDARGFSPYYHDDGAGGRSQAYGSRIGTLAARKRTDHGSPRESSSTADGFANRSRAGTRARQNVSMKQTKGGDRLALRKSLSTDSAGWEPGRALGQNGRVIHSHARPQSRGSARSRDTDVTELDGHWEGEAEEESPGTHYAAGPRTGGMRRPGGKRGKRRRGKRRTSAMSDASTNAGTEAGMTGATTDVEGSSSSGESYSEKSYDVMEQESTLEKLKDLVEIREDEVANVKLALREEIARVKTGRARAPVRDLIAEFTQRQSCARLAGEQAAEEEEEEEKGPPPPPSDGDSSGGQSREAIEDDTFGEHQLSFDVEVPGMQSEHSGEAEELFTPFSLPSASSLIRSQSSLSKTPSTLSRFALSASPLTQAAGDRRVVEAATKSIFTKLVRKGHEASVKVKTVTELKEKVKKEEKQGSMLDAIQKEEAKVKDARERELQSARMLATLVKAEHDKLGKRLADCEKQLRSMATGLTKDRREALLIPKEAIDPEDPRHAEGMDAGQRERRYLQLGLLVAVQSIALEVLKAEGKYQNLEVLQEQIRLAEARLEKLWQEQQAQLERNSGWRSQLTKQKYALQEVEEDRIATLVAGYKTQQQRDTKARKAHARTQCEIQVMNDFVELRARALAKQERLLRREVGNYESIITNIDKFNAVTETELCCKDCLMILKNPHLLIPCGHSVCKACVPRVMKGRDPVCPDCGVLLTERPVPNTRLEAILNRWYATGTSQQDDSWEILTDTYRAMKRIRKTLDKWEPAPYGIFLSPQQGPKSPQK